MLESLEVAGKQPRLDDPEDRRAGEQGFRLARGRDGCQHALMVRSDIQALDRAKHDFLELELRLAGLQPLRIVEGQRDRRAFLGKRVPRQPAADGDGNQRNQPHQATRAGSGVSTPARRLVAARLHSR